MMLADLACMLTGQADTCSRGGAPWHHSAVEAILVGVVLYLTLQSRYRKHNAGGDSGGPLSEDEVDEICAHWAPAPLVDGSDWASVVFRDDALVTAYRGVHVTVDGVAAVNFATFDFLGLSDVESTHNACEGAIQKYGVGSCGPRGFYGTMDVHLELERELAEFMGTEASIVYSYDVATIASVVAVFVKGGDVVVHDEGLSYPAQSGLAVSRATVRQFAHNDLDDLQNTLLAIEDDSAAQRPRELNRRFIVVEGIYLNTGTICPLVEIMAIAEHFRYRVLVDESMALGVLGATGRGACEHHGVAPSDVTLICASMSTTLASIGGFVAGGEAVTAHQRLSSTGYCFSASLPPFHAVAASSGLRVMREDPGRLARVRANAVHAHALLQAMLDDISTRHERGAAANALWLLGDDISAIKHLHLHVGQGGRANDTKLLQTICDVVLVHSQCALVVADYSPLQTGAPRPSIRLAISSGHTPAHLERMVSSLRHALVLLFEDTGHAE